MVGQLAANHGDTPPLTHDDLLRDLFSEKPWISIVVAEIGGKPVGYAAKCGLIQLQFGARGMDRHHLFTDTAFRGQGVDRSLVEACKIEAVTLLCRYVAVGTHPDNHDAQAFYTSLGFERRGAHPRASPFDLNLDRPSRAKCRHSLGFSRVAQASGFRTFARAHWQFSIGRRRRHS
ncbi:N-acetyltransferase [Hyphomonas johnsonii MHS-2]|uniref:N-acetyltransferase n=2 Tax=Hyphomonas johnsonii TaxID=81031 RepID=A0A059FQT0_9PROT|nr:N-acetyltransferase [Hyphomonas johnsonii MHS-2]